MVVNPKRKSRAKKAHRRTRRHRNPGNPRAGRRSSFRRRAHRNPANNVMRVLTNGAIGALAGLATVIGVNALASKITQLQDPMAKALAKGAVVVAGGLMLPKVVGPEIAVPALTGAGAVVGADVFREFVAPKFPGLSDLSESQFQEIEDLNDISGYTTQDGVAGFIDNSELNGHGGRGASSGIGASMYRAPWNQ